MQKNNAGMFMLYQPCLMKFAKAADNIWHSHRMLRYYYLDCIHSYHYM